MESSKATTKHIRQVAGDLPAAQIQLMQHLCTELSAGNYPKRKKTATARQKPQNHRFPEIHTSQKPFDLWKPETHSDRCTRCGDTLHTKGFQCPARKFQCKACHKFVSFHYSMLIKRVNRHWDQLSLENPKHNNFKQRPYTPNMMQIEVDPELSDTEEPFCLQMKIQKTQSTHSQVPKPVYLMANLVYHLQLHHKRNQYLCARLDTCADVNLMPMAIYCLMFKDPGLRKLTPSSMEIETYTNDVVKIIGTCQFYLVHPESKQLMKVIFFITKENGSVLLSCRTTMELGLIKPHARLDYLPPRASLLTSMCDQPSKTKTQKPNIHCTIEKPTMVTIPENVNARAPQLWNTVIPEDNQLITRKEHMMARFPDIFEG